MTPDPESPDEARFRALVVTNPVIRALLARLPDLDLPDCWIVAGALMQTVWNALEGRDPGYGIRDYDVFYFDPDTSWEAENRVIERIDEAFADVEAEIEVRNQARVHLWFDRRNGTDGYPRLRSSRDGIDRYLGTTTMLGLKPTGGGTFEVYAPMGFDDLFGFVHRPNPAAIGPGDQYDAKSARWMALYPRLTVVPWSEAHE